MWSILNLLYMFSFQIKVIKSTDFTYTCKIFLKMKASIKQAEFKEMQGTSSPTLCMESILKPNYKF